MVDSVNMIDDERSTRERLLNITADLLAEEGPEVVSLREIARRAGVSHNAPLKHFPSLGNLLAHVSADGFRELVVAMDAAVAAAGRHASHRDRLLAACRAYCSFATTHPGPFALMFRFDLVDRSEMELAKTSHAAFDALAEFVAGAQSEDWQPDVDSRRLTGAVWAAVHGAASLWLDEAIQPSTRARRLDEILDPLLSMLVPTTRRTRS